MLARVLQPGGQVVERLPAGDVVDQQGTGRAPVIGPSDRPKRLLTSLMEWNRIELGLCVGVRTAIPCPKFAI